MLEHMAYLVFCEKQEACWRDFTNFEVDGRRYRLAAGTIRNNLLKLRRQGKIEVAYRSVDSYYTLSEYGVQHSDKMTVNHARVYKRDVAELIERMAFDTPGAHDIHLRFSSQLIWRTLSVLTSRPRSSTRSTTSQTAIVSHISSAGAPPQSTTLSIQPVSKDIVLPEMTLDVGIKGIVTVHRSDTVSVILSCSRSPIKFDIGGLVRLSCSLARIEERLLTLIDIVQGQRLMLQQSIDSSSSAANPAAMAVTTIALPFVSPFVKNDTANKKKTFSHIPEYGSWIVTMWHIGRDSLERYTGEKFEVAWGEFTGEWSRVYSKERMMSGKSHANKGKKKSRTKNRIVRIERQEYPKERLRRAVEQKLSLLWTPTVPSAYAA